VAQLQRKSEVMKVADTGTPLGIVVMQAGEKTPAKGDGDT
jgi:hypothetical protein